MRKEDEFGVFIYQTLKSSYKELSKDVGEYKNIIGIFFHELMIYITNYYLLKNSEDINNQELSFPFLNSNYVNNPFIIEDEELVKIINRRYKIVSNYEKIIIFCLNIISYLTSKILIKRKIKVGFFLNNPFSKKEIIKLFIKYQIVFFQNRANIDYSTIKDQFIYIENLLKNIFSIIEHDKKNQEILVLNFISYIKIFCGTKNNHNNLNFFLNGSMTDLNARIIASQINSEYTYIIACGHGVNPFCDFDEPLVGYGEISYCDYYIEYGEPVDIKNTKFIDPLQSKYPIFLYRNSEYIKKIYKNRNIPFIKIDSNIKICYVPTNYSGNFRYSPFRDMDDIKYYRWQSELFSLNLNITFKSYPSENHSLMANFKKINRKKLEDVIDLYDIFIIDYYSTVHAILAATKKPIIYYNIGLRNINPSNLVGFKQRVFWVDIKWNEDLFIQIQNSIEKYNSQRPIFYNSFTESNSLNKNNIFYLSDLIDSISNSK